MIQLTNRALEDMDEIEYYLETYTPERVAVVRKDILKALRKLALTPLLSRRATGLDEQYREWTILKAKYKVHYRRLNKTSIMVLRVRSTKRRPLTNEEIIGANHD